MAGRIEARCFKGTADIMPEKMIPRKEMLSKITSVFERYGFAPLETPAMEYLDILLAKSGQENAKLIYKLAYDDGNTLGLRFDLTVPLARLVAMRPELPLPFKRYQIQPVFRGERHQIQQGRFREFYQCDVDTIGTPSMVADAENLTCALEVYESLGIGRETCGLITNLNHRKLLRAMVESAGLPADLDGAVCGALDKLDKEPREAVAAELAEKGVSADAVKKLFAIIDIGQTIGGEKHAEVLGAVEKELGTLESGKVAVRELREVIDAMAALGAPMDAVRVDLSLARGMDYYTGPIYEFRATKLTNFGSLGGGGRYDELIGFYCGREVPATGVSVGLSRVQEALEQLGLATTKKSTPTRALVVRFDDQPLATQLALVRRLREGGVPSELFYEGGRFKKQIVYAEKKGIPFVVIQGSAELEKGVAQVKELATGVQVEVPTERLAAHIAGGK